MTRQQLAEQLEVTPRYVQMVEGGQENLTVKSLATLAG
ncbi:MAG: helix-turn-helix transcriptional regulator, partial [Deltaproteobacteria bacterium]|nr:helix-turn-helix transcriptional regulator [Deltaproteobacteria bacterium]MBW2532050.1 helix-turn-helix transcriptional regulator [Deltaproteobacteria bacterium]